ncbi:MAG: glycosyltransferase, partial [Actinobacteria bacterium]|nr:glycosyltransferase [Actinomycetota bacterium]
MKKILVVCMFDSIHSARWLSQFKDGQYEFLLFPSSPHRRLRPELKSLLQSTGPAKYRLFPGSRFFGLPFWLADKFLGNFIRGTLLRIGAKSYGPDLVHALELQNAGYVTLKAFESRAHDFKIMVTNWGSDIFWFQRFPKHREKLVKLLSLADYYSAECTRDIGLAKNLGFKGVSRPVIPNAGGFSEADLAIDLGDVQGRKKIAIKGYQGWVGRAVTALDSIALLSDQLEGFELVIYSANLKTIRHAKKLEKTTGLKFTIHPKGALTHKQVLELFRQSRVYVGLSESDGISTSLLEAMAMGAIPVQTATACCDEWFTETGVAIRNIEVQ